MTPASLWERYSLQFWEVTACQWQKRFDPTYATYTAGLGNYDYLARLTVPGVFVDVAAVQTTGKIKKPLVTVAGTMDALLPIVHHARAYEAAVKNRARATTISELHSSACMKYKTAITSKVLCHSIRSSN